MKTPAEIKKALDCCNQFRSGRNWNICSKCPCDIGIGRCDGTLETDALAYIQQLEAQVPRWIPVTEKLPELSRHYGEIRYSDDVLVYDGLRYRVAYYSTIGEWSDRRYGDDIFEVTHWMPIPEPPEEEEE